MMMIDHFFFSQQAQNAAGREYSGSPTTSPGQYISFIGPTASNAAAVVAVPTDKNNLVADCSAARPLVICGLLRWRGPGCGHSSSSFLFQPLPANSRPSVRQPNSKNVHVSNCRHHLPGSRRLGQRGCSGQMLRSCPLHESRRRLVGFRWRRIRQQQPIR